MKMGLLNLPSRWKYPRFALHFLIGALLSSATAHASKDADDTPFLITNNIEDFKHVELKEMFAEGHEAFKRVYHFGLIGYGMNTCPYNCMVPAMSCHQFINPICEYGSAGHYLAGLLKWGRMSTRSKPNSSVELYEMVNSPPADVLNLCPRYQKLERDWKVKFWVWTIMALSFEESTCNTKTYNSINPQTAGALQLENPESRRRRLRPIECEDKNIVQEFGAAAKINDLLPNLRCGLAMLAVQTSSKTEASAESRRDLSPLTKDSLFSKGSYWEKLRGENNSLAKRIRSFPACM